MRKRSLLVALLLGLPFSSSQSDLLPRGTSSAGGFAIRENGCAPSETYCSHTIAGFDVCCPGSLNCFPGSSDHCCPTDGDCLSALEASPQCADSAWNLCGGTTGYFCCTANATCYGETLKGVNAVGCLLPDQALATGQTTIATVSTGRTSAATSSPNPSTTTGSTGLTGVPTGSTSMPMTTQSSHFTSASSEVATPSPSDSGGGGGGGQGLNTIQTVFTVLGTVFGAVALGVAIYECRKGGRFRRHQALGQ